MLASTHMSAMWQTMLWAIIALGITLGNVFSRRLAPKAIRNKLKMEAVDRPTLESTKEKAAEEAMEQQKATYGDSLESQLKLPSDDLSQRSQTLQQALLQQSDEEDVGEDVEVTVEGEVFKESSVAMSLSSPMFKAMLQHQMTEGMTKKVSLQESKEQYAIFRRFLQPRAINSERITMENVDDMLILFDRYGMREMMDECQDLLLTQPANMKRLEQAAQYNLTVQKERCVKEVAADLEHINVTDLPQDVEIMNSLLVAVQNAQNTFKDKVKEEKDALKDKVKEEKDAFLWFKAQVRAEVVKRADGTRANCPRDARLDMLDIITNLGI